MEEQAPQQAAHAGTHAHGMRPGLQEILADLTPEEVHTVRLYQEASKSVVNINTSTQFLNPFRLSFEVRGGRAPAPAVAARQAPRQQEPRRERCGAGCAWQGATRAACVHACARASLQAATHNTRCSARSCTCHHA